MLEDTKKIILKVIQGSDEPLTLKKISRQIPELFRVPEAALAEILANQAREGAVHEWPAWRSRKRFWKTAPEEYIQDALLEELSQKAMNRSELRKCLRKYFFQTAKYKADELTGKCLSRLLSEKRLLKYPRAPRKRSDTFGVHPPDPAPYLSMVKKEIKAVCDKLRPVGVPEDQVYRALQEQIIGHLPPMPEEKPSHAGPFQGAPEKTAQRILQKACEIDPDAARQSLISIKRLRRAVDMDPGPFDRAVIQLADEGKVWLHRHAYPAEADEDEIVRDDRGNCYMGLVIKPQSGR